MHHAYLQNDRPNWNININVPGSLVIRTLKRRARNAKNVNIHVLVVVVVVSQPFLICVVIDIVSRVLNMGDNQ